MLDLLPVSSALATPLETIIAISLFCICFLFINIALFDRAFPSLLAMLLTSYGLIGGIMSLETSPGGFQDMFAIMAICGAIAQFSIAGTLFLGLCGGLMGFVLIIFLGFICCPIIWLRIVFNILLIVVRYPKKGVWPALLVLGVLGSGSYAPTTVHADDGVPPIGIQDVIGTGDRDSQDNYTTEVTVDRLIPYYPDLTRIKEANNRDSEPVCYAVTVECTHSGKEFVLIVNQPYSTGILTMCCREALERDAARRAELEKRFGDLSSHRSVQITPASSWNTPVLELAPCKDAKGGSGCTVHSLNGVDVLVNGGRSCSEHPVQIKPGMTLWIPLPSGDNDMHVLHVRSLEYLDAEGRSCSKEGSMFSRIMHPRKAPQKDARGDGTAG